MPSKIVVEKIRLDISCELSPRQTIHIKCKPYFLRKMIMIKKIMFSAAFMIDTLIHLRLVSYKKDICKQCIP